MNVETVIGLIKKAKPQRFVRSGILGTCDKQYNQRPVTEIRF